MMMMMMCRHVQIHKYTYICRHTKIFELYALDLAHYYSIYIYMCALEIYLSQREHKIEMCAVFVVYNDDNKMKSDALTIKFVY